MPRASAASLTALRQPSPPLSYPGCIVLPSPFFTCALSRQVDLLIRGETPLRTMEQDVIKMLVTEMKEAGINIVRAEVRLAGQASPHHTHPRATHSTLTQHHHTRRACASFS